MFGFYLYSYKYVLKFKSEILEYDFKIRIQIQDIKTQS